MYVYNTQLLFLILLKEAQSSDVLHIYFKVQEVETSTL